MRQIMVIFCTLFFISTVAFADAKSVATKEVTQYIKYWSKKLHPRHRRRALHFVKPIVHWSLNYGVDPLLVVSTMDVESSFYPNARGPNGEVGLMQLHSKESKARFKIWIPAQNIRAGTKWLKRGLDTCGSVRGAIAFYNPGKCNIVWPGLKKRLRLYQKAVKMFRK